MKYLMLAVISGLVAICYYQRKENVKLNNVVKILQHEKDSLHSENFPCQIELSRYQRAYQIFTERNPKAAEEYGTIISDETE
jgi:hypothetical protein